MGGPATLGAEEELHLIDPTTKRLSARAPQLLSRLPKESYGAELQRTTIETNTEVVTTLDGLRDELMRLRRGLIDVAAEEGLCVAAVGTPPQSAEADVIVTSSGRFGRMQDQYRLLVDEQLICGTQIHVGVDNRDLAIDIAQRIAKDLPTFLALSASSPFWNGHDTGYSSIRTVIWHRWPSAGLMGHLNSAAEYDKLLADLVATGVIADAKMAYFDVRPSAHAPTLELRICDATPIVDDAVLIAGLFRALVREAELDSLAGKPYQPIPSPLHRAALWQAARGGLTGNLLNMQAQPTPHPAQEIVSALVDRLRPHLDEAGDTEEVERLLHAIYARGNSADRQRAAFAERGQLDDVIDLVIDETHGPADGPEPSSEAYLGYKVRAGDEAIGLGGWVRQGYSAILEHIRCQSVEYIQERYVERDAWLQENGVAFRVGESFAPFEVDLVPRLIPAHSWRALEEGLKQRARALELFLRDVYTDKKIVEDGVVGEDLVSQAAGWRQESLDLPADVVRAPVMGFDLVCNEFGYWRVLEDNLRNPSGLAFSVAAREVMDAIAWRLPRPDHLREPAVAFSMMRSTLLQGRPAGARGALFTSGPTSAAWYEHQRLARELGFVLVDVDDIDVVDGKVIYRTDGEPLDVLYLRLDDELVELRNSRGEPIGEQVFRAAATGAVGLANAPGTGVADDKALYRYVPELIGYYLDETPLIDSVPTYRTTDEVERQIVLERVGELVTKPVDGYGGNGVLIGPAAGAGEVAARRREIAAHPAAWVAQEVVMLSSIPTFSGAFLEPRHVDLRVFAFVTGTGPDDVVLAPVALTRVGSAGNLVVNSSQGGGAKDTWIIGEEG